MDIVISSGHGKYIRGASGDPVPPQLDEVDEARLVVEAVATYLRKMGVNVVTFHDDTSEDQDTNLKTIVSFHNSQPPHDYDVSVHFNAYDHSAHGTEVLYATQSELAEDLAEAISLAGDFVNRGPKYRDDLYVLDHFEAPAVLIETCFCDNDEDAENYHINFDEICVAIAEVLSGEQYEEDEEDEEDDDEEVASLVHEVGRCSWFGGPEDDGVAEDEGLAFFDDVEDAPQLFLAEQPPGTTGLARRLNPNIRYVAMRWDYQITPKDMLADPQYRALVRAKKTGKEFLAWPADWGPHEDTKRVADISPSLMEDLGIETDDEIEVTYPVFKGADR